MILRYPISTTTSELSWEHVAAVTLLTISFDDEVFGFDISVDNVLLVDVLEACDEASAEEPYLQ